MTGYYREVKRRYYDYDLLNWIYYTQVEAVITNNIKPYNAKKKYKFKELPGDLADWYTFIMEGTDDYYVSIDHVYMWRKSFHEE